MLPMFNYISLSLLLQFQRNKTEIFLLLIEGMMTINDFLSTTIFIVLTQFFIDSFDKTWKNMLLALLTVTLSSLFQKAKRYNAFLHA